MVRIWSRFRWPMLGTLVKPLFTIRLRNITNCYRFWSGRMMDKHWFVLLCCAYRDLSDLDMPLKVSEDSTCSSGAFEMYLMETKWTNIVRQTKL